MPRDRKPSAKLQFIEAASAAWSQKQAELAEKRPERQAKLREKKRAKKEAKLAKERNSKSSQRERERAKKSASRARKEDQQYRSKERKAAKAAKDGNRVKRALSAYMFFASEVRTEVKERYPNASFGEVGRILGEWWGDLEDDERAKYEAMHDRDVLRYNAQVQAGGGPAPRAPRSSAPKKAKKKKKLLGGTGGKYHDLARDAILSLKDRNGSSQPAIEKWIQVNHPDIDINRNRHLLRNALKTAVGRGFFLRIKNSWKVNRNR